MNDINSHPGNNRDAVILAGLNSAPQENLEITETWIFWWEHGLSRNSAPNRLSANPKAGSTKRA